MLSNDDSFSNIARAEANKDFDLVMKAANEIDPLTLKEASIGKDMLKKEKK